MASSDSPSQSIRSPVRALSSTKERKLVDYLEEHFLQLTRGFKKRSEPTTHLPNLTAYLTAARPLLSLILQIPPIDPSTSLRTALLLRLTGDTLSAIPGYPVSPETLAEALSWLDDLDCAWECVLRAQVWDAEEGEARDLVVDVRGNDVNVKTSPVTPTERARLRSLIVGAGEALEDWLEKARGDEEEDVESMLERMGLQGEFDALFRRSLDCLGGLGEMMIDINPV
ncbi:hypothetical protein Hypma_013630 [Hypsizygus marmoreus]|uniref:Uncharacterized protein n=1 Tax=Hypsizygus marmoreus TaxID=39966 RepID=A0A369JIT0_HYPMA|nr:hypothetical protein Hypma_013630 [Hypsizygus marmoreus]